MELVPIDVIVDGEQYRLGGRSKAIHYVAKKLNVTVATLYRWINSGDHFVADETELNVNSVFKLVKCIEK